MKKSLKKTKKIIIFLIGVSLIQLSFADTITTYSQNAYSKLSKDKQNFIAKEWNITSKEYSHYLDLMQNSPSGKWYQQLNPAEVLGINAANDKERMHYAMIVVKNAHDRITNELAFQRAYSKAWQILYPNLKPVEDFKKDNKR